MSANYSVPGRDSNVELMALDVKPNDQKIHTAEVTTTTQPEAPSAQKTASLRLTSSIQPTGTLSKSGTYKTRTISDALATEEELRAMKRRQRIKELFELFIVIVLILVVWALMFLPTIFFHIDQEDSASSSLSSCASPTNVTEDSGLTCASSAIYSPPTTVMRECSSFLQEQKSCLGLAGGDILIPSANNIDDLHTRANLFLSSLPILNPSPACQAVVEQFICYFIFGLCDSGELYQPSSTQCTTVTSDICGPEFMMAMALAASLPELIPQCDTLPDTQMGDCSGNITNSTDALNDTSTDLMTVIANCSEGFYLDGVCRPECGEWQQFSDAAIIGVDFVFLFSIVVYLISAAAVIVLSLIRYKRMLKFPSVFVVYGTLTGGVYILFILFGYFNRDTLFCSSRDLQESVCDPTTFCTVQGIFLYYCPLLQTSFWFCHVLAVFWTIKFPVTARRFENKGYFKFVHLGMVVVAMVLPWTTVGIALGTDGYVISRFPTILCFARNVNVTFYAFVLPLSIILATGMTLIVIIFWVLIGLVQIHNESKKTGSLAATLQAHLHINPAELKILIVFGYSIVFAVIGLISFTVGARDATALEQDLTNYFICESRGIQSGVTCPRDFTSALIQVDALVDVSVVLLAIYPIVNLVYVVNIQELKAFFKNRCGRQRSDTATTLSSI